MPSAISAVPAYIIAALVVGCAVGMLSTKNVVHAAFWMLGSMLATAALYVLLSAGFLALVQVMVYAGAVAVLTIFVVMITLRSREDAIRSRDFSLIAVGLALAMGAASLLVASGFRVETVAYPPVAPGVAEFGRALFTTWLLPFELASLLLTIALVGAVWWSVGRKQR
jgi:NADH-quinone oxidoreductase subunit J